MRTKKEKKLVSLVQFELITAMLQDASAVLGATESSIIEDILLGRRPPLCVDSDLAKSVMPLYMTKNAVATMFSYIFSDLAVKSDLTPMYLTSVKQLIELLHHQLSISSSSPQNSSEDLYHIKSLVYYLTLYVNDIEDYYDQSSDQDKLRLHSNIEFGRFLIAELSSDDFGYSHYCNISSLILATFDLTQQHPVTYRLLASLVQAAPIPNTAENRYALTQAIVSAALHP